MAAQVTQAWAEVLRTTPYPGQRATEGWAEALRTTTYPGVRATEAWAEVLIGTQATLAVTQAWAEVLKIQGLPVGTLVTQAWAEALLVRGMPLWVTQAWAETLRLAAYPPVQVTQAWAEALVSRPQPTLVTQAWAEVLVVSPPAPPPPPPPLLPPPPLTTPDLGLAPLVNPDPTWEPRLRRLAAVVSEAFNSLARQGYLTRDSAGNWAIGQPAGPTGVFSAGSFGAAAGATGEFLAAVALANGLVAGGTFKKIGAADLPDLSATYLTPAAAAAAYQPLDADLTAIAALSGTNTIYYRSGANTWSPVTIGTNLTFAGGTLSASGGGGTTTDPITAIYPTFTPAGVDDEFSGASFTGWTLVDDGTHQATVTQTNNVCSLLLPGGDTAAHLHAWLKTATVNVGDVIEMAFNGVGLAANSNMCGLIMADGTTYGSGKQVLLAEVPNATSYLFDSHTGFNTQAAFFNIAIQRNAVATVFLRLVYSAANTFDAYTSVDGISWVAIKTGFAVTMTPTAVGFFATTWGGATGYTWSVRYFRKH